MAVRIGIRKGSGGIGTGIGNIAEIIAGIESQDPGDKLDYRAGLDNKPFIYAENGLPNPDASHKGSIYYDDTGKLWIIHESHNAATAAAGTWSEYTASNFEGITTYLPAQGNIGDFIYDRAAHSFYQAHAGSSVLGDVHWRSVSPQTALGANAVWLGERDSEAQALHAITDYDNTKTYYAFFGDHVQVLDGSTYVAPTDPSITYNWLRIGQYEAESIAALLDTLGQNVTFGTAFPDDVLTGSTFIFSEDVASGLRWKNESNGNLTAATKGDVAQYDGTNWVRVFEFKAFILETQIIPFEGEFIGAWQRHPNQPTGSNYVLYGSSENGQIAFANNNRRAALLGIRAGHGIIVESFGNRTYFRVDSVDTTQSTRVTVNGAWLNDNVDATGFSSNANIYHIPHVINVTPFIHIPDLSIEQTSLGTSFPSNPVNGENFIFISDVASISWWDPINTTTLTSADRGDVAQWVSSTGSWHKRGNISGGGGSGGGESTINFGTAFPDSATGGDYFVFTADVDSGLDWESESGGAITSATRADVARFNESNSAWRRIGNLGGEEVNTHPIRFGTSFPTDPAPIIGDYFIFTETVSSGLTWQDFVGTDLTTAGHGDIAQYLHSNGADRWVYVGTLASEGGGGGGTPAPVFAARAERIAFNALSNVQQTERAVVVQTSNPISVAYGGGSPQILETVSGQTGRINIQLAGIYIVELRGTIDYANSGGAPERVKPHVVLRDTSNNIIGWAEDVRYHRSNSGVNEPIYGMGVAYIPRNDTVVVPTIVDSIPGDNFSIDAGWTLSFTPLGVKGEDGSDAALSTDQLARLLPTLPGSGSRDDKILRFDGNTLGWEDLAVATPPFQGTRIGTGSWTAGSVRTPAAGGYYSDSDEIIIDNNSLRTELLAIEPNQGIIVERDSGSERTIFIVTGRDGTNNARVRFEGYWVAGQTDITPGGEDASFYHITHDVRMARWVNLAEVLGTLAEARLSDDTRERLLPALPPSGSRDTKIPKFRGNTLEWQEDGGSAGAAPFTGSRTLGKWDKSSAIATGTFTSTADELNLSYTDADGVDQTTALAPAALPTGQGLVISHNSLDFIFVIESRTAGPNHMTFHGFWAESNQEVVPSGQEATIDVIQHETRMIEFVDPNNQRLLPHFPSTGSRDDKILRFNNDTLDWEDLAVATGMTDGKVIYGGTNRPEDSTGKIGDTYFRRQSNGIGLYEKTGASEWTYRYALLLLPNYPSSGSRNDKILRFDGDGLGWEDFPATTGGTGLTPDQIEAIRTLQRKAVDLHVETAETWTAAEATRAQFAAITGSALTALSNRQPPTGATGWTNDQTLTTDQVIGVRIKSTEVIEDYRLLIGTESVRLDSYFRYASDSNWNYYASRTFHHNTGRIRLQHHGTVDHTSYSGKVTGERALPELPAEGSRKDKIVQFNEDALEWVDPDFVTQQAFDDRHNHTPNRGDQLPPRLLNKEFFVLQSNTHWADEFYRAVPVEIRVPTSGQGHLYTGINAIPFSARLPVFGSDLPDIFRADRIAAIFTRRTFDGTESGPILGLKVVLDKALIPTIPDPLNPGNPPVTDYDNFRLNLRTNIGLHREVLLTQTAFFADELSDTQSENEMTFAGRTYVAFTSTGYEFASTIINLTSVDDPRDSYIDFHISHTDPDGAVTFLSDDNATAWVAGDEYPAGLYEGDGNGHPIEVIAPIADVWAEVLAKSDTFIRAAAPTNQFGVNGNKWFDFSNGKGYIKQNNAWVEITDFALQREVAAIPHIERSTPHQWYRDGFANLGSSGSAERISAETVTFYGMRHYLDRNANGKAEFVITGNMAGDSSAVAGGSMKVSLVDSNDARIEIGTVALTGSNTGGGLNWRVKGDITAIPSDRFRIALETTGIAASNLNTWVNTRVVVSAIPINRLLPEFPAAGSRDNLIPKFNGDTLIWEADGGGGGGGADGTLLYGGGIPANSLGKVGDTYFRLATSGVDVYRKTASTTWTFQTSLGYRDRSLPTLPATGSRDDKILRFDGNNLGWEDLSAMGISAAQIARLLPELPAEGSRNRHFPMFTGNTLAWQNFPDITAIAEEWADIGGSTTIAEGTVVHHSDGYYGAITTHTKSATGPDGDSTNWVSLSSWGGAWSAKFYLQGSFVLRNSNVYVATQNITSSDVAPDHASNTKWLQLGVDSSRILPTLPSAGSRDDKILRFDGNNLGWEDLATATGAADGKVIYGGSSRPDNDTGKVGDTYLRRLSSGNISLYEKTGTATWTYRYDILLLPSYPTINQRNDKILRFDGNALGWEDLPSELPTFPAEGSRNDKILRFNNDALGWEDLAAMQTGGSADGTVLYGTSAPQNDAGKVGDTFLRHTSTGISVYEKTASTTWTFRFVIDISRLLPGFPASGSRDDKILRFDGNGLGWEDMPTELPTLPATGSRNDKILRFADDALAWEDMPDFSDVEVKDWDDISGTIPIGTIVRHDGAYYGCISTHSKRAVGPNANTTDWVLFSNYTGTWAAAYHVAGTITLRNSNIYIATSDITDTDVAPDNAANTKWLRLNVDTTRLLPELPASGSRDDKILRFDGNALGWEDLPAGSLTSAQQERLLPTLPASGSRNDKFPIFNSNDLRWEDFPQDAIGRAWTSIPQNSQVLVGTLAHHNGQAFIARATHSRGGTGPDGDSTNWRIITNWYGAWVSGWYPIGTMVERNGAPYVALSNVSNTDPAPDASTNTKWLRMNSDIPNSGAEIKQGLEALPAGSRLSDSFLDVGATISTTRIGRWTQDDGDVSSPGHINLWSTPSTNLQGFSINNVDSDGNNKRSDFTSLLGGDVLRINTGDYGFFYTFDTNITTNSNSLEVVGDLSSGVHPSISDGAEVVIEKVTFLKAEKLYFYSVNTTAERELDRGRFSDYNFIILSAQALAAVTLSVVNLLSGGETIIFATRTGTALEFDILSDTRFRMTHGVNSLTIWGVK